MLTEFYSCLSSVYTTSSFRQIFLYDFSILTATAKTKINNAKIHLHVFKIAHVENQNSNQFTGKFLNSHLGNQFLEKSVLMPCFKFRKYEVIGLIEGRCY